MSSALAAAGALVVALVVGRVRRTRSREAELVDLNRQLAAMGARLTTLLAHTEDAVVISSDHGSLLWTSPSFTRLLGWDQPIERTLAPQLVHPDDVAAVAAAVLELREGRRALAAWEGMHERAAAADAVAEMHDRQRVVEGGIVAAHCEEVLPDQEGRTALIGNPQRRRTQPRKMLAAGWSQARRLPLRDCAARFSVG